MTELTFKSDYNRFFRFLMVGLLNSVFGYGFFALFYFVGIHYSVALFLSTVVGVLFNFKTTGRLVFKSNNNRLIMYFSITYAVVYVVNVFCLKVLSLIGFDMYIGGAILVLPMALLAYTLNKRFVFKDA